MEKSEDFNRRFEELRTLLIKAINDEVARIMVIAEMSGMADEGIPLKHPITYTAVDDQFNEVIDTVRFDVAEISYMSEYQTSINFTELSTDHLIAILEQIEEMET